MADASNGKERVFFVEFNESLVRHALGRIIVETFRSALLSVAIMAILGGGGLVVVNMLTAAPNLLILYLLAAIAAASVFWGMIVFLNYFVTLRDSLRLFRGMPSRTVEFQLDRDGILLRSSAWSGTLPWTCTLRLIRHRGLWLIGLGSTQVTRNGPGKVKMHSVLGEEVFSGESLLKLWRLPILWTRPSMSQLFLVVPIAGMPEGALSFIAENIKARDQSGQADLKKSAAR